MSSIMENDCKWPVLPVVDVNLDNAVTRFRNIRCNAVMNPFAFLDEFGVLEVSRPVVGGDLFVETGITCTYQPLLNNSVGHVVLGKAVEIEFHRPTPIRHDQFVVQCLTAAPSQEVIYKKAFVNVAIAS
ncbi:hypothetical protein ANCCAN_21465, partial [Ancylostoma caninum]